MLWLRELCSFMSKEQNDDEKKTREDILIQTCFLKRHSIHYLPQTELMSNVFTSRHCAFLIYVPFYSFTLTKSLSWNICQCECQDVRKINSVTHWWQQRDDWPCLHLSHPSLLQDLWQSAQCSPWRENHVHIHFMQGGNIKTFNTAHGQTYLWMLHTEMHLFVSTNIIKICRTFVQTFLMYAFKDLWNQSGFMFAR